MDNGNENAFPQIVDDVPTFGLTKRELFSAMAMSRLAEVSNDEWAGASKNVESVARMSVAYADALIAELAKVKP